MAHALRKSEKSGNFRLTNGKVFCRLRATIEHPLKTMKRRVRTEVRQIRNSEYIIAARCMGAGFFRILWKHLVPNFFSSIMFMVVMNVRTAMISEATLSFMGIGLPIEIITWGSMLSLSDKALMTGSWWIILIPGIFLVATVLCLTNIGNACREQTNRKESNF